MTLLNNFIIPLVNTLFVMSIIGTLLFIIGRYLYYRYNKYWKFYIKYRLLKKKLKQGESITEIFESLKDINIDDIKKDIILNSNSLDIFNELKYLKQQGGKIKND